MTDDDPVALDRAFECLLNARDRVDRPDGSRATMKGSAIEIARRQKDVRGLFAMDMPYGTPAP